MSLTLVQKLFQDKFDITKPMPAKKPFSHEIIMDTGYDNKVHCGFLSNGSFVVVSGPTGVGKSTFLSMISSSTYKGDHMNILSTEHLKGKTTLWIDTESPEVDFKYFQRDIVMNMSGMSDENQKDFLWAINLTKIKSLEDKRSSVYELFEALGRGAVISLPGGVYHDLSKVGLVVFDGIADIIENTTDESLAKREIETFKYYVEKSDRPVITVLHSDKKGTDLVGRFGTLLGQKASGSIMMKSSGPGEPVTIKPHKGVRGTRPFGPFEMMWDRQTGNPYIDAWEASTIDFGASLDVYENYKDEY
jgi:KaiC/GvpD/RAD55 family RecA-like ATPase